MRDRFGARDARSQMLRFHAQTAGSTLTAIEPLNNIARTTVEALAAVLGGAQSVHTNGYDEALALPTEASARVALRTQQILAHESGVADVIDPLGGAYALESLTSEIEARARALIDEVDRRGGMVAAIEAGFPQREIERRAFEHQRAVEAGTRVIVGVNRFADAAGEAAPTLHRPDPALEAAQVARLQAVRAARDAGQTRAALADLRRVAGGTDNIFPALLGAVKTRATLGEIADVLRDAFGEYRPA
jgi:methylmalonyl-CoA mutase N-terminal domain/subunit